jgi:HSP20 family protein
MSLIKFNDRLPLSNSEPSNFLTADDFFINDFFEKDSLMPAMNIKENNKHVEVEVAAPGSTKEDFNVTLDEKGLHISVEKSNEQEDKEGNFLRKDFNYNSFRRSLNLPDTIDHKKEVLANYRDGILKLVLLKKAALKTTSKKIIKIS